MFQRQRNLFFVMLLVLVILTGCNNEAMPQEDIGLKRKTAEKANSTVTVERILTEAL